MEFKVLVTEEAPVLTADVNSRDEGEESTASDQRLTPSDESRAPTSTPIFFLKGASFRQIASHLNGEFEMNEES